MAKNNMGMKTKNRILEAARLVFNEKGYEAANVDEIAAKADITKAMVYYHFESKESIMLELVKMLLGQIQNSFQSEVGDAVATDTAVMHLYIGKMMDVWKENREIGQFIASRGIRDEAVLSRLIQMAAPFFDLLVAGNAAEPAPAKSSPEYQRRLFLLVLFNTLPMIFANNIQMHFSKEGILPEEALRQTFVDMFTHVLAVVRQPGHADHAVN